LVAVWITSLVDYSIFLKENVLVLYAHTFIDEGHQAYKNCFLGFPFGDPAEPRVTVK